MKKKRSFADLWYWSHQLRKCLEFLHRFSIENAIHNHFHFEAGSLSGLNYQQLHHQNQVFLVDTK